MLQAIGGVEGKYYLLRGEMIQGGFQLVGLHPDGQLVVLGPAKSHLENGRTRRREGHENIYKAIHLCLQEGLRDPAPLRKPSYTYIH